MKRLKMFAFAALAGFGLQCAASAAQITGVVYVDSNQNGQQDEDEGPYAGATVKLYSVDSEGNLQLVATLPSTGADGVYTFDGVAPGQYVLEFVFPTTGVVVQTIPITVEEDGSVVQIPAVPAIEPTVTYTFQQLQALGLNNPSVVNEDDTISPFVPPSN